MGKVIKETIHANAFTMSPKKWIENTGSIGIVDESGDFGGRVKTILN